MKKRIIELKERKRHFQWVVEQLSQPDKVFYLEKDWYDNPTLISKEDAKKEVEQVELELLQKEKPKSIWQSMRRLFHISEKESTMENNTNNSIDVRKEVVKYLHDVLMGADTKDPATIIAVAELVTATGKAVSGIF